MLVRQAKRGDEPQLWALNNLPFKGNTANQALPLELPLPKHAPPHFQDLQDIEQRFLTSGDFVVIEHEGRIVGMGGFRQQSPVRAEVLRVRVHPAMRRRGVGRAVMIELERRAIERGHSELWLDTTTEQPEAIAFYRALGYEEIGRETRPEWSWTLVYFLKQVA